MKRTLLWAAMAVALLALIFVAFAVFGLIAHALPFLIALAAVAAIALYLRTPGGQARIAALKAWCGALSARLSAWVTAQANPWASPARDATHADYRATYQALATMPARGERENLTLVQILEGLKNYGDDPINTAPKFRMQGLGGFGGFASFVIDRWQLLVVGLAIAASGWGANFLTHLEVKRLNAELTRVNSTANHNADVARELGERLTDARAKLNEAQSQAQTSADNWAHERRRNRRHEHDLAEIQNAMQHIDTDTPPDWGFGDAAGADGLRDGAENPAGGDRGSPVATNDHPG